MKVKNVVIWMSIFLGVLGFWKWSHGDEPLDPRIAAYDKGPATIDVSKYPAEIQEDYKLFAKKCTHCHTLARPINCDFALPDEWSRYVKRMMRKPDSQITPEEAKKIYDFLVYDSKTRKKDLYEKKLKESGQPATQGQ
jgi:hypothetical protein